MKYAAQLIASCDREQSTLTHTGRAHTRHVAYQVATIVDEPFESSFESGQPVEKLRLQGLDRKERDQPDHRANPHRILAAIGKLKYIVEETIRLIPQPNTVLPAVAHGVSDVDKVLPELAGNIFVGGIFAGQFQRNRQQVQGVHGHPTGAIRLLDVSTGGQRSAAVKHSNVVEAEEAALKDVHPFGILAVYPPGEIQQ